MGQKVNPYVLRLGINRNWRSLWYADRKDFQNNVIEDSKIRSYIKKKFMQSSVSYVVIERVAEKIKILIASAKPGLIIGRRGSDIEKLKVDLASITKRELSVDVIEIKNPAVEATLIAQNICFQLEKRVAFRRAMKRVVEQAMQSGAKGIKVAVAGRLGGAEMARREVAREGSVPLQTLRADIDYGTAEAQTTYGKIGVKVWVYKGEIIPIRNTQARQKPAVSAVAGHP
ncbi:MAG: 30S ribosomal protein S3 [Candidatus Omnitrophica bacterium]|nr:30S ribosomal protein S3 [Candidatus Omnitrophota bacterium]